MDTIESFLSKHELQLYSIGFPQDLQSILFEKLRTETLDAGLFFRIQQHIDEKDNFISQEAISVHDLHPNSNVFIIDHAWTTRLSSVRETLSSNYKLLNRLKSLTKIRGQKIELIAPEQSPKVFEDYCLDFDDQGLTETPAVLKGTQGLSLWGNNFETISQIEPVLNGLKALWLNENPISKDEASLFKYFEDFYPDIEILNSKFTKNAKEWALKYVCNTLELESVIDVDLSDRDIVRVSPEILNVIRSIVVLDISGNNINEVWENYIFRLPSLKKIKLDPELEDWAWRNLKKFSNLKYINEWDTSKGKPELVDHVISNLWSYTNSYRLTTIDTYDENSVFYVLDELGSSILHSDIPNCKLMPFLYYPDNGEMISYSLLWPVVPIRNGDILYRDYLFAVTENEFRSFRLYPWFRIPDTRIIEEYNKWVNRKSNSNQRINPSGNAQISRIPPQAPLKIATDLEFFAKSLTDPRFVLTDLEEADILWTRGKIFDGSYYSKDKYLNQFPNETCIVLKNLLAQTVQSNGVFLWLPVTYDLNHQLPAFMGDYLKRQKAGEDNHWITKPCNMSRGIDCHISNSLDFITRLIETGPKIAQKYIESPFLLYGKKIDLRFIVLLRSASPLIIYTYNHFWIRSANIPYTLSHVYHYSYDTHFTVMNYSGHQMKHIKDDEFIDAFNESTQNKWNETLENIYKTIKELFVIATNNTDMAREKSRAIYGIDVMLDSNLQPYILEVNFCPDCERAVNYYPEFTNQVFNCLFYEETEGVTLI
jgi:tubulin--tyrosine ligase-like protein 12